MYHDRDLPDDGALSVAAADDGRLRERPMQNGLCESFNGRLRDELLNETLFRSLAHARMALEGWRRDYNTDRPHSRLGWLTPAAYAATFTIAADAATIDLLPYFWTDLCWKIPV